ncbi:hypothetical protein [Rhodoferax sp. GW822-FHT02A01]|uniref:hypothetical protein n=1 Tax=Rhodoferax sp. GW822-FHT02A01 TaxID=3141537 RepID=UPI00315C9103
MAGTKGRSGGARPGAGRKPKAKADSKSNQKAAAVSVELEPQPHGGALKRTSEQPVDLGSLNMLEMLQSVALGKVKATSLQVRAAIAAVQYTHTKRGDGGKKDEANANAKTKAAGRFAPSAPPKLVATGGKKIP